MAPRRIWYAMDAQFTFDPRIQPLGEDFGPGGPLAIAHMMGVAKLQDEGGQARMRWTGLARGAFLRGAREAREIVEAAAAEGVLEILDSDERGFVARFTNWGSWQTDPTNAERQARHRARKRNGESNGKSNGEVTGTSRGNGGGERDKAVASNGDVTRDSSTEDSSTPVTPLTDGPPAIEQQAKDFSAWLAHHEQVTGESAPKPGTKARAHIVTMFGARQAEGYSLEDLKHATVGAFTDKNRNENGWYDAESVLRPTKVHKLVQAGRRRMAAQRAPDSAEATRRRLAEAER